jgi:hypothetical protein
VAALGLGWLLVSKQKNDLPMLVVSLDATGVSSGFNLLLFLRILINFSAACIMTVKSLENAPLSLETFLTAA